MFADLALAGVEGGTDITALMGAAKTLHAGNIAAAVLLVLAVLVRVSLTGSVLGALEPLIRFGWILPVMIWTGSITQRQVPELSRFIEDNLLK